MQDAEDRTFGEFRLRRRQRQLLKDGVPVGLSSRAFDILAALLDADGAPISKDELMRRVWPDVVVEENNLTVQIASLRKALGSDRDRLRTVARHGYSFAADAGPACVPSTANAAASVTAKVAAGNIPIPVEDLIGREQELRELLALQSRCRLLTLTGPGGIGKTRLALELARRQLPAFSDGAYLAELAALGDAALVPASVASALGLEPAVMRSAQAAAAALAGKTLLLVVDNCEHVVAEAARVAETLLHATAGVHIIATSREPLAAEGEHVYRVTPLGIPGERIIDTNEILRHGAVQLFIARARAAGVQLPNDDAVLNAIGAICRRLEGIPLALELAAARVPVLGVDKVLARLDDRFALLAGGRRTALPRQQTLRATLDWSYSLLTESERIVLRRCAIFSGTLSVRAARDIVSADDLEPSKVEESLYGLTAKSLLSTQSRGRIPAYYLLDTTRVYALERLSSCGEREVFARRHAEYYRALFERAEAEWKARPTAEWLGDYGPEIDNLRAALDWAFSLNGDAAVGIALTAAAVPLWMHLSLVNEGLARFEQALRVMASVAVEGPLREMKLQAALGATLMLTGGRAAEGITALTKALSIAESLGDAEYSLRSLSGLMFFNTSAGRHRRALELGRQFRALAATRADPNDVLFGERLMAISQHLLGDQTSARSHLERVFAGYIGSDYRRYLIRFQFDLAVGARGYLARVLWLLGYPDQAMQAVERAIGDARATNHAVTLCFGLALAACPIARLVGDLDAAEHYADFLVDQSNRNGLALWSAFGRLHHGLIAIERGDSAAGLRLLVSALSEVGAARFVVRLTSFLDVRAEAFAHAGNSDKALAAIADEINHLQSNEELWLMPELLRRRGELLLHQNGAAAAEEHFRQALDEARGQRARSWELRAATSLAQLLKTQGRRAEAAACLESVCASFTEGFATNDYKAAKAVVDAIQK